MITVTKLNGTQHVVNALFIESLEATPDTMVTLTNGRKYVVKETVDEVIQATERFYQRISLLHKVEQGMSDEEKGT